MTTKFFAEKRPQRRWFSPKFSLRMLMLMVTATAVGSAFWWRWPVTRTTTVRKGSVTFQETFTYHRGFGGELIKHGVHRTTVNGEVELEEYFREGVLHGPFQQSEWSGTVTGEYFDGKKHGTWNYPSSKVAFIGKATENPLSVVWPAAERYRVEEHWNRGRRDGLFQWWDQTGKLCFRYEFKDDRLIVPQGNQPLILRRIAVRKLSDTKLQHALVQRCDLLYRDRPLHAVIAAIEKRHGVRLALRSRRIAVPSELISEHAFFHPLFERHESPFIEQWLKAVPTLREKYLLCDAHVRVDLMNVPLYAGLDAMLAPLGLVLDYRNGVVCIVDANAREDWEKATGAPQLHPPTGSPLAARLDQPAKPISDCTLRRAIGNLAEVQEIPVELRFNKEDIVAREYLVGWLHLPAGPLSMSEEQVVAIKYSSEPPPAEPLTLRQLLSLILDQANLHCHEENGVLIIEPPKKTATIQAKAPSP